ncbi:BTAD domain-containing putative transcriptional regulator [Actinokineospora sp. G85]|uniref:BTAD domain-containing putative transcriptional regulator n=1 Tax=Actinokineospora sp. G85 TaxID=3406626 RepID=UPI003C746B93
MGMELSVLRFGVLGPLEVRTASGVPVPVREAKVRTLLVALLAAEGRTLARTRLIGSLWPGEGPANPSASLQVKVSQLRRALDQGTPGGRNALESTPSGYALHVASQSVDFRRFGDLVSMATAEQDPAKRVDLLGQALALWRGPAFSDHVDEEFVRGRAIALEEQRLVALEDLAHARLAVSDHAALAGELAELVEQHPLRERLWSAHLLALYRAGRVAEALRAFADLRAVLAAELGADPGPELTRLHEAMLRQDHDLLPAEAPVRVEAAPVVAGSRLPAPVTELVGRGDLVEEVRQRLAESRLVTLVGAGGVGKTRLAVALAGHPRVRQPDGVWLVELANLSQGSDHERVAEAVMEALRLRGDGLVGGDRVPAAERVSAALRGKRALVILDNCEHVVEQVTGLVDRLLAAAPGLRLLATSQELLGVDGEVVVDVPPLELPEPGADPGAVAGAASVELFLTRARASSQSFAPDPEDLRLVAAICRRLDGIPLAIEMAATRVRMLGLRELLDRLDDRFQVLGAGRRGAPARQQTLAAMIEWSWGLCTEPEQVVLGRLALHAQGCRLSAAEAICGWAPVRRDEVLTLLGRLVDRSLVSVSDHGGHVRYRLLESVAAYGRQQLALTGDQDATELRFAAFYTDLAEVADAQLRGPEQDRWLERLDAETANLGRAMTVWARRGAAEQAQRLASALGWFWFLRGRLGEGTRMTRAALDLGRSGRAGDRTLVWHAALLALSGETGADSKTEVDVDLDGGDPDLLRALWFLSHARWGVGALEDSADLNDAVLRRFRDTADTWGTAAALMTRAALAMAVGDLAAMRDSGEESLRLFQFLGDQWGQLRATDFLGVLAEIEGDYPQADRLHQAGLVIARELGLPTEIARKLAMQGRIALLAGDYAEADRLHADSARLAREQAHLPGEEFADVGLAISARRQGRFDEAEGYLARWVPWLEEIQAHNGLALVFAELGFLAELRGDAETALDRHLAGLVAAERTNDGRAVALALEGLAGARLLAGRADHAAHLLGAAAACRTAVGAPIPAGERFDLDRIEAGARTALGASRYAMFLDRGAESERGRGETPVLERHADVL